MGLAFGQKPPNLGSALPLRYSTFLAQWLTYLTTLSGDWAGAPMLFIWWDEDATYSVRFVTDAFDSVSLLFSIFG